jgi:hypothetical protein
VTEVPFANGDSTASGEITDQSLDAEREVV